MRRFALLASLILLTAGCQAIQSVSGDLFRADSPLPASDGARLVGALETYRTVREDTLPDIARRFEVGFVELRAANPDVDVWLPGEGRSVVVPKAHLLPDGARAGIVVNLPEMRLYHFGQDGSIASFPIGVGREGWATPQGTTRVVRKKAAPTWYPPTSIRREKPDLPRAVPPGPDNPLGSHAIYLGWPSYLIHGTNEPFGVGRRVSHGCIRMYPDHIADLYAAVAKDVPVSVVDQPVKWAWIGDDLYVEAHPTLAQADSIEADRPMEPVAAPEVADAIRASATARDREIDDEKLERAILERRGYPIRVSVRPPLIPWLDL